MALSSPACLRGAAGSERYPCPCCGHLVFGAPPGSHEICPVCFWEDDDQQLALATTLTGANRTTLADAQRTRAATGACEERLASFVRPPRADEPRDPLWRPIDPARDHFPRDGASPYYWRR
ncbi:MAG TPA: CPCC family cysteine-rich protein [Longimicrobium sp.]